MKSKVAVILSAAATLAALLWVTGLARAGPLARPNLQGGAPTVVSYQGQVMVDGSLYDGTGYFKFAIVSAAGTTTYWSNDGTSTGGGEPSDGTSLPVTSGLFNVLLGDTSLTNMTQPLDASVFSGRERYLRVWFSTDNITFQQLSPGQRIAAVPYALQAEEAANADSVDGEDASAFADATHTHAPGDISPQGTGSGLDADTLDGEQASAFADAVHTHAGLLLAGAMVLGPTDNETTLIAAGFSYTGLTLTAETGGWLVRAAMPTGRRYLAAAAVEGVIYAIGGTSSTTTYETKNEAYDPVANSWSTKAAMPTARRNLAAAVVDGVVYAIGGNSSATTYETKNEAYNPVTDSWSSKAAMPTGRRGLAAAGVGGVVYAIGGRSSATSFETANEAYDPVANSWSPKAAMLQGRYVLAAAVVDGVVYAIGGSSSTISWETKNEAYDPVANSWSTKAAMPTGRRYLAAAAVEGVVYAIGGDWSATYYETKNEAYDPVANSWSAKAPMPTARSYLAAAGVDGVVYAIGGYSSGAMYETKNEAYGTHALYVYSKD